MAARFPFDSVTDSSVKLKNTPIELKWNLQEGSSRELSSKRGMVSDSKIQKDGNDDLQVGFGRQSRWFRPPPKVRIVPGILGSLPGCETRGVNPSQIPGGEDKVSGDFEAKHSSPTPLIPPHQVCPQTLIQSPSPISAAWLVISGRIPLPNRLRLPCGPNLVKMQPRGGGRRLGWQDRGGRVRTGYGGGDREGFAGGERGGYGGGDRGGYGTGRQDRGGGSGGGR